MKKWITGKKALWWIFIPCLPLIIACVGYYLMYTQPSVLADQSALAQSSALQISGSTAAAYQADDTKPLPALLNSLYSAFRIYGLSVDSKGAIPLNAAQPYTLLLEIARWMALIVSASIIIELFHMAFMRMRVSIKAMRKNSIALHGDEAPLATLKKELGVRAITDDIPEKFNARTHIVAFDKESSLYRYLNEHYTEMSASKNSRLYLCTLEGTRSSYREGHVSVCNIAENCARFYWQHHWLKQGETKIVLIGFGRYGQNLLKQALLVNVYSECRELEYHIFGETEGFMQLHPGIARFAAYNKREVGRDALFLHEESWKRNMELLCDADRILLCSDSDEENMHELDLLLEYGVGRRIEIRSRHEEVIHMLWPENMRHKIEVNVFGTDRQMFTINEIIHEELLKSAKLLHARYHYTIKQSDGNCASCYKKVNECFNCKKFRAAWNELDVFLQDSNIAQADHIPVKVREVLHEDVQEITDHVSRYQRQYACLAPSEKKKMWAMEHERWCRFLYYHGWEYAPQRDNLRRKHPMLLPFEQLPEKEWGKDENAFIAIGEICELQEEEKGDKNVQTGTGGYQRRKIAG